MADMWHTTEKEWNTTNVTDTPSVLLKHDLVHLDVIVYGYITPPLVVFTAITNILICVVLLKPNMRSPTNCMLVAMALSDMFTGLIPLIPFVHFYTFGHYAEWMPYGWCLAYDTLIDTLPTAFHTASIWLTVALAVQRYICVCRPTVAVRLCTVGNVAKTATAIYVVAFISQLTRFAEFQYHESEKMSLILKNSTVTGCRRTYTIFLENHEETYYNVYYWFRVVFIHLIPCMSLVVINALLIYVIRKAQERRRKLLRQNRRSESHRLKDSNCTTLMLVLVVGVFLVVEFPLAIVLIIYIYQNTFSVTPIMNMHTEKVATLFINLIIMLSYPANFFIYCAMSRQFRETFKRLFTSNSAPLERYQSHYMISATENGAGKMNKTYETKM